MLLTTMSRRGAVVIGVPALYVVLGSLHPLANPEVGDDTTRWMYLHVAQLFLIGGMGWTAWLLVDGLNSRAARVTRALVLPYAIAYTALDSIAGLAWGAQVADAQALPAAERKVAGQLLDASLQPDPAGIIIYLAAGLLWLSLMLSVVVALRGRVPRAALALMAVGAIVFAVGHPRPFGPIGMLLICAGVVWVELGARQLPTRRAGLVSS